MVAYWWLINEMEANVFHIWLHSIDDSDNREAGI